MFDALPSTLHQQYNSLLSGYSWLHCTIMRMRTGNRQWPRVVRRDMISCFPNIRVAMTSVGYWIIIITHIIIVTITCTDIVSFIGYIDKLVEWTMAVCCRTGSTPHLTESTSQPASLISGCDKPEKVCNIETQGRAVLSEGYHQPAATGNASEGELRTQEERWHWLEEEQKEHEDAT